MWAGSLLPSLSVVSAVFLQAGFGILASGDASLPSSFASSCVCVFVVCTSAFYTQLSAPPPHPSPSQS